MNGGADMGSRCARVTVTWFVAAVLVLAVGLHENPALAAETYENLTLDQCIEIALAQYPPLKNQRESVLAAESAHRAARGDFLPVLTVNAGYDLGDSIPSDQTQHGSFGSASVQKNFEYGGSLSVTGRTEKDDRLGRGEEYGSTVSANFQQPLLEGAGPEVAAANVRISEINEDITRMALTDAIRSHILTVIKQYNSVIEAERLLQVRDEALKRSKESLERTEALVKEGEQAAIDIATQELTVASGEEQVTQASNNYDSAIIQLRLFLGIPPDQDITLALNPEVQIDFELDNPAFTPRLPNMEDAKRLALERRLDYLQRKRRLEVNEIAVVTSKNVLLPDLSLFGTLGLADSGSDLSGAFHVNEGDWVTGVQFEMPFGLVREKERHTQAQISLRQATNDLEQSRRVLLSRVDNTVRNVETSELRLVSAYKRVKSAMESEMGTQKQFEEGERNALDVALAREARTNAEADYVSLFLSYKNMLAELDYDIGEPTEERYGVSL
jgi:outer membrane protein TolC